MVADGEVVADSVEEVLEVVVGVDLEVDDLVEGVQVDVGKIEREKVNTLPSIKSVWEL